MVGITGLAAGVDWILEQGVDKLYAHEQSLSRQFIEEMTQCPSASIIGPQTTENRCGVFSLDFEDNPHAIAARLEEYSGIQTRSGLHCAPFAHETMGTTHRGGTVRVSFGPFHTSEDVSYLVQSLLNATEKVLL
jgi:selenocysteine lyase/cysteine desulfurase